MHDLLSLPQMLVSLDGVPDELRAMYRLDDDGVYTLTDIARASMRKIAQGIEALAKQRDEQQRRAQAALLETQITGAILACGSSGPLWAAAVCLFESEHKIAVVSGNAVVKTDAGDVPLGEAIRAWMAAEGSIFLSDDISRRQRRAHS
jgi:hypothetical protein